ncbi:MAG: DUF3253 domain-containing protein [Pseudomonadota bacterium]
MSAPDDAERAILDLLAARGADKTICPSEAARALARVPDQWRSEMERVHKAVDALNAAGEIQLSWKGVELDQRRGAYRIARR